MANCEGSRILRRQPRQGVCRWCTRSITATLGLQCAIDDDVRAKLRAFFVCYGRTWRAVMRGDWDTGDDSPWKRVVRNVVGPSGLARVIVDDSLIKPGRIK